MSLPLRIILIVFPIVLQLYIVGRIRKLKMKAEDALFWLVLSSVLVILGLFPIIAISVSDVLGVLSPANFVFLIVIALLLYKCFSLSTRISVLERKISAVAQSIAIEEKENANEQKHENGK